MNCLSCHLTYLYLNGSLTSTAEMIVPDVPQNVGTSCAAMLPKVCHNAAQVVQQCCRKCAAMLPKDGRRAAEVWQVCCKKAAAMMHEMCPIAARGL